MVQDSGAASEVANEDLRDLMRLLGMPLHARPVSPHEVFQNEVLPVVQRWREALGRVQADATYADNGDDLYTISGTTYALVWAATDPDKPTPRGAA